MTSYRAGIILLTASLLGCLGPGGVEDAGFDAGPDTGLDAGTDAGFDAGIDTGADAGLDAGADGGFDAGLDAGSDAGSDSGTDSGIPFGSVRINNNAPTTDSPKVTLNLTARDDLGITGYFASEASTRPNASQMGWTAVPSTTPYAANPAFTLSAGNGTKTVRVWFKDAAGNVSNLSEDSIGLQRNDSWKNAFFVAWRGTPAETITYARQVGYEYIAITDYSDPSAYVGNPKFANTRFLMSDPQYSVFPRLGSKQVVDTTVTYSPAEIAFYNNNLAWKGDAGFPNNIATGWLYDNGTKFNAMWDYQQQRVIDMLVEAEIALFKSYEDRTISFLFAGYGLDLTRMTGDFNRWDSVAGRNVPMKLEEWTGLADSSLVHPGITHEYPTYSEGWVAHIKKLNARMREEFPNAKWIIEPWVLYDSNTSRDDEWVRQIQNRADKLELIPDLLQQEAPGTQFVDDTRNFSNVPITKDMVGISQQLLQGEVANRLHAAKAAMNGAWYNWFGRFGSTAPGAPNWASITQVYPRLKLIRLVPNWDNLRNVPLSQRVYNGLSTNPIYSSKTSSALPNPTSYFDADLIYSRHWKNNNIFVVFNTPNGTLKLNPGEVPVSIWCTDEFLVETRRCESYFDVTTDASGNKALKLKPNVVLPDGGSLVGDGYIIHL